MILDISILTIHSPALTLHLKILVIGSGSGQSSNKLFWVSFLAHYQANFPYPEHFGQTTQWLIASSVR